MRFVKVSYIVWMRLLFGCLLITFLTGCTTATPETPTANPTAIPTETSIPPTPIPEPTGTNDPDIQKIERIEATFDGDNCIYDGPGAIYAGEVVIALNNISEYPAHLGVDKLVEGKTWQDVLDAYGDQGSNTGRPDWLMIETKSSINIKEPNSRKYILEPGLHAITMLATFDTGAGVYTCAPLDVREEP